MTNPTSTHAAAAAEVSLLALCALTACFLPPLNSRIIDNVAVMVLVGIGLSVSLVLHLMFVGALAKSHGRSAARYAALALATLPVGSIIGLIYYEWSVKVRHIAQHGEA